MTMTLLHPHRTTAVLFIALTMIHNINVSINCLNRLKKIFFFLDLKIKIIFVVLNQKLSRWNPRWDEPWAVLPVSKRGTTSQMYRCKDVSCYKHKHMRRWNWRSHTTWWSESDSHTATSFNFSSQITLWKRRWGFFCFVFWYFGNKTDIYLTVRVSAGLCFPLIIFSYWVRLGNLMYR